MLESYLPNLIAHTSPSIDCVDLQCLVNTKVSNQPVGLMIASPVIHKPTNNYLDQEESQHEHGNCSQLEEMDSPQNMRRFLCTIPPIVNFNYELHKYSMQLVLGIIQITHISYQKDTTPFHLEGCASQHQDILECAYSAQG